MSKLDEKTVRKMREEYAKLDISQPKLARKYGLSQASVNSILLGQTWQHAGGPITKRGKSKLTDVTVREIKKLLREGVSQSEIARRLDVGSSTINAIATGVAWSHVT